MKKITNKRFKHSLSALAVSTALLVTAPTALAASNTSGSIYGQAKTGATVTFKNKNTGLSRDVIVGADGRFNFKDVPTGKYTVTSSNGISRDILVTLGTGSSVLFDQSTEVIQVFGSKIRAIDTSSVESTMVFTQEQVELLPIGRDSTSIALLTPGTVAGDDDFGNLPSFGGSSVGENGFYINGFDVTSLRTLLSFAELPFDAIGQTQVKTGGYGAEFGRSLGGITNVITKKGTNEWQFGGAVYYSPDSLREPGIDTIDRTPSDEVVYAGYNSDNYINSLSYNFSVGGPIIEDTLFMYANVEFQDDNRDYYNRDTSDNRSVTNPNGIVTLDWYITDNHILSGTYIQNETEIDRTYYVNSVDQFYTGKHGTESSSYTEENGGDIFIINYNGHLTDNLSLSLMYGELENKEENKNPRNPDPDAALCALAYDTFGVSFAALTNVGCFNPSQTTIGALDAKSDRDERNSYKIDFDYTLGDHNIRAGYNNEEYTSFTIGSSYTGNNYYRYIDVSEGGYSSTGINGVDLPLGTKAVRVRTSDTQSGSFKVENTAFYIEDNWQVTDDLLLYFGVRNETFTNYAANGEVFVEADDLITPRTGFSWDIDGDSSKKLYGTLGRYYIPIAGNTNIRATRLESSSEHFYYVDGFDPATGEPVNLGAEIGTGYTDLQVPDPRTIAVADLDPMHQDEFILGYQQQVSDNWTAGVKFMYRKVQDGMDDMCAHDGFFKWAEAEGIPVANEENGWVTPAGGFDVGSTAGCLLINPGKDLKVFMDLNGDGEVTEQTVSNEYFDLPEYKRSYKGLEFTLERAFADGWYTNISYVYSKSEGNIEGYVNSTLGQEDAGATQDFDHKKFQDGSDGYLPNDRRHQFKAYGAYKVTEEITLTANMNIMSGTPLSCNGYITTDDMEKGNGSTVYDEPNFKRYGASSFYCGGELTNRGDYGSTDWSYMLDAGVTYVPDWADNKLTLKMDVFNLLNLDKVTEYNQTKDLSQGSNDVNPNFLAPTGYQAPRSIRFTARYNF